MKQATLILMICIYSLSTVGLGIRQFYCCGKLKSTDITFIEASKGKCGMGDEKTGCCKFKFKSFKVKDSHVAADGITVPAKHFTDVHLYTPSFEITTLANQPMTVANTSHAPPLCYSLPIYILNCVYRI